MTSGYDRPCRGCDGPHDPAEVDTSEFDVYIENDVIIHIRWHDGLHDYQRDGVPSPTSDFIVLRERPAFLTAT